MRLCIKWYIFYKFFNVVLSSTFTCLRIASSLFIYCNMDAVANAGNHGTLLLSIIIFISVRALTRPAQDYALHNLETRYHYIL